MTQKNNKNGLQVAGNIKWSNIHNFYLHMHVDKENDFERPSAFKMFRY